MSKFKRDYYTPVLCRTFSWIEILSPGGRTEAHETHKINKLRSRSGVAKISRIHRPISPQSDISSKNHWEILHPDLSWGPQGMQGGAWLFRDASARREAVCVCWRNPHSDSCKIPNKLTGSLNWTLEESFLLSVTGVWCGVKKGFFSSIINSPTKPR